MFDSSEFIDAEKALERGDYRQCLIALERLSKQYPVNSKKGARLRMLMATAWMGQGDEKEAIATCKALTKVNEPEIRQQAKQLISILEAPALPRPESWSVKIPKIDFEADNWSKSPAINKKSISKSSEEHPPTGATKAFGIGFSAFAISILIAITLFLNQ